MRRARSRSRLLVLVLVLVLAGGACSDDGDGTTVASSGEEIAFLQGMYAHHGQAVQLGLHTARNGSNETVRSLALEIAISQAREQGEIQAFLLDREATVDPSAHGDAAGMIAAEDLAAALGLEGTDLDERFVALMIGHHEGAVAMADEALGGDELSEPVRDLAARMASDQEREITELELLRG